MRLISWLNELARRGDGGKIDVFSSLIFPFSFTITAATMSKSTSFEYSSKWCGTARLKSKVEIILGGLEGSWQTDWLTRAGLDFAGRASAVVAMLVAISPRQNMIDALNFIGLRP